MIEAGEDPWKEKIRKGYEGDPTAERIRKEIGKHESLQDDGIITFKGMIYVPTKLQKELIREIHEAPAHGHPGIDKTIERISRNYYFP